MIKKLLTLIKKWWSKSDKGESPTDGLIIKLLDILETAQDLKDIKNKVKTIIELWRSGSDRSLSNTIDDVDDLLDFIIKKLNENNSVQR